MTLNNKILPIALVAALLGGSAGAFMMRPSKSSKTDAATANTTKSWAPVAPAHGNASLDSTATTLDSTDEQTAPATIASTDERDAYRDGFQEGVRAAQANNLTSAATTRTVTQKRTAPAATRVVYRDRSATRARTVRSNNARQVYYDYNQPQKRSFWQKHRDKLTVAAGAGGGAVLGGLIGGKKGAAIGAIAGGGGSALYTYKLRKRNRTY